jgi:hypothetical protein
MGNSTVGSRPWPRPRGSHVRLADVGPPGRQVPPGPPSRPSSILPTPPLPADLQGRLGDPPEQVLVAADARPEGRHRHLSARGGSTTGRAQWSNQRNKSAGSSRRMESLGHATLGTTLLDTSTGRPSKAGRLRRAGDAAAGCTIRSRSGGVQFSPRPHRPSRRWPDGRDLAGATRLRPRVGPGPLQGHPGNGRTGHGTHPGVAFSALRLGLVGPCADTTDTVPE